MSDEEFKEDLEQEPKKKPWWETRCPTYSGFCDAVMIRGVGYDRNEVGTWMEVQNAKLLGEQIREWGLPTLEDLEREDQLKDPCHYEERERWKKEHPETQSEIYPTLQQILNDPELKRIAQDALRC